MAEYTSVLGVFRVPAERHAEGGLETVPPVATERVGHVLMGRMKGIQGHCNSCYMDAALFRSGGPRGPNESRQPLELSEGERQLKMKCCEECLMVM